MSIIRACKIVERCPCVNFPTAIMAWLKEYPNNCSTNALTVTALCALGISLPHFHYQECKSELNIHMLPESRACNPLFLRSVCHLSDVRVHTWLLIQPPLFHLQSLTQLDIVFNHEDSQAGLRELWWLHCVQLYGLKVCLDQWRLSFVTQGQGQGYYCLHHPRYPYGCWEIWAEVIPSAHEGT